MATLLDSRNHPRSDGLISMAMCSAWIGRVAATGRWTDLRSIVGYVLGLGALVVIGAGLLGFSLPFATFRRPSLSRGARHRRQGRANCRAQPPGMTICP